MARNAVREPRHVPIAKVIGTQPDLFGGPTITHEAPRRPVPKSWGRALLRYHLADTMADLDGGSEQ